MRSPLAICVPVALVSALGVACGGSQNVAIDPKVEAAQPRPERDPGPCPLPIAEIRATAARATFVLPPSAWGTMQLVTVPEAERDDEITYTYELRDERGLDTGAETYVCDGDGVALQRVEGLRETVHFSPPVITLPTATSGGSAGSSFMVTETWSRAYPYKFWYVMEPAEPAEGFADLDASWRRVQTRLIMDVEGVEHEWVTETLWAISDRFILPLHRHQRISGPDGESERREVGERVIVSPRL